MCVCVCVSIMTLEQQSVAAKGELDTVEPTMFKSLLNY